MGCGIRLTSIFAPEGVVRNVLGVFQNAQPGDVVRFNPTEGQGGLRTVIVPVLRRLLNLGYITTYQSLDGLVEVVIGKSPSEWVVRSLGGLGDYMDFINGLVQGGVLGVGRARTVGGGFMYVFSGLSLEYWASTHYSGFTIIDPSTAYTRLQEVLTMFRDDGFVSGFACNDKWLLPTPRARAARCWFTVNEHGDTLRGRLVGLLRVYVLDSLRSGGPRLNVRRPDSPILLSLGGFRRWLLGRVRGDPVLRGRAVVKGGAVRIGGSDRSGDVIGSIWRWDMPRVLGELARHGLVRGFEKVGSGKYIIYQ